jgi:hypothetical protein
MNEPKLPKRFNSGRRIQRRNISKDLALKNDQGLINDLGDDSKCQSVPIS